MREVAPWPPMASKTDPSDWTMSTSRNYHDNENWRCVRVRMGGGGRSHSDLSPPFFPLISAFTWYYVESASFFFSEQKTQLRRIFLNAIGLNWQKGSRHGATLYPPSAPPPFRVAYPPSYIYIIRSSAPLTRPDTVDIWLFWRHAARHRWFNEK